MVCAHLASGGTRPLSIMKRDHDGAKNSNHRCIILYHVSPTVDSGDGAPTELPVLAIRGGRVVN